MQVIDSRKLSVDENLWLKNLSNRLNPRDVIQLCKEIARREKTARTKVYIDVITRANARAIREAIKMSKTEMTLDEIFEEAGFAAKWEARGKARGKVLGKEMEALAIAKNMVQAGYTPEAVASMTKLSARKVMKLYPSACNSSSPQIKSRPIKRA